MRPACKKRSSVTIRVPVTLLLLTFLLAVPFEFVSAQSPSAFDLDDFLRRAFLTREFQPKPFGPTRWMDGGKFYTTTEGSSSLTGAKDVVRYETVSGKREILIAASELIPQGADKPVTIENYDWSADTNQVLIFTNSRRVWRVNTRGDYWLFNRTTKTLRKLGGSAQPSTLMFAKFSPDAAQVAYVRENEIYVESVVDGRITRLTQDATSEIINGTTDWVYEEEFFLRDGYRWSPDSKRIAYWQFNSSAVQKFPLLYNAGAPYEVATHIPYPQYGKYPVIKEIPYPEPGTANSTIRIGVVPVSGGATKWLEVPGDSGNTYIPKMDWAADSGTLALQHLNRLQNTNEVLLANANTGAVHQIYQDQDAAWVDVVDDFQWLHAGKEFLWVSEKDGWRHVYLVSRDGRQERLVTPGNFDVIEIAGVSPDEAWLYYLASPENATQRFLFRVPFDGHGLSQRLTPASLGGTHSYELSPDFRWAIHSYSTFDTPPVTDLVDLSSLQVQRVLEENSVLRTKLQGQRLPATEFFHLDIGAGVILDAWMMKPKQFDPSKRYPVLVFVYGEPAGQTVVDRWDGDNALFHRALTEKGYAVVSIDNRGTPAPRGRAWRKIIYGSVGVLSSAEQVKALRKMEESYPFLDSNRVAVWGWSGGGSNTLNLMFRSPDVYKVGMSVAPVADQRLYDTIYQERYMGLPQDNADGYKSASAINFAEGLRGNLLVVHSSGDDNVHFQGTEYLINRLVELGKPFDFMEYPGRTHSLSEGAGTHYHLYSLLARYLQDHLPAGPLP